MGVEYRVSLPDHDWVVAAQHKLIPSVTAAIQIKRNEMGNSSAVTFSGSTFIRIRSGKHSSSTAFSHALDFQRMVELDEFKDFAKTSDGRIKPIVIKTVDA